MLFRIKSIRTLLHAGFDEGQLRLFCLSRPEFRRVHESLDERASKAQVIDAIIEHAKSRDLFSAVTAWAEANNPEAYAKFAPYWDAYKPAPATSQQKGGWDQFWKVVHWVGLVAGIISLVGSVYQFFAGEPPRGPDMFGYRVEVFEATRDRHPIANTEISMELRDRNQSLQAVTDAEGNAIFIVRGGHLGRPETLHITAAGYRPYTADFFVIEQFRPTTMILFPLEPSPVRVPRSGR